MINLVPFIFDFAALGAIFLYGYLTAPDRPRASAMQPIRVEANRRQSRNQLPRR